MREGRREHKNTIELENDLDMMLEINFTSLTALLRMSGNAKGWLGMTTPHPPKNSPSVPYPKSTTNHTI